MLSPNALRQRAAIFQAVRSFFSSRGYLEVDTPLLLPLHIPETNIKPLSCGNLFLQSSPEMCMKILLAGDIERIFQICKCFRADERGDLHLNEFTMLEWYRKDSDYLDLMEDCEMLVRAIVNDCQTGGRQPQSANRKISLQGPWQRLTVGEAFRKYSPVSLQEAMTGNLFDEIIASHIEPRLGWNKPTFLYDYPAPLASLARTKKNNPAVAERFELYIGGIELANGFSELTDAVEQRQRFMKERGRISAAGNPCGPMPEKFLRSIAELPPTAGIALGLDRLVMLFLGEKNLDRSVSFTSEELEEG